MLVPNEESLNFAMAPRQRDTISPAPGGNGGRIGQRRGIDKLRSGYTNDINERRDDA